MNDEIRKSKIYSYFHGAGTVFQQFLIAVGVLFILMGFAAGEATTAKAAKAYEKYNELQTEASELYDVCNDLYYEYWYDFEITRGEMIEVSEGDEYYEEKTACNEALAEYQKAYEKAEEAHEKYEAKSNGESAGSVLFPLAGGIIILAGIIWSIYKKLAFSRKPGEEAYDEEIQVKVEEAKIKALEKLNIVAEQIDRVEPVVLNGIATYDASANKNPIGKLASLFQNFLKLFTYIDVIILGSIVAAIYFGFSMLLAQIGGFIVAVIGAFALVAIVGVKLYKKYEKNSYISPKTIKKLEKMYPSLIFKLGTDDCIRVSLPAITVYMFGDEQIYMYYQYFDIVTGKIFCEGIHEYFYEDIVGVISAQETKKMFKRSGFLKLSLKAIDYLKESITVVSSGCQHSESYIVPIGSSLLDTSFVGMRNLIRQKKSDNE